MSGLLVFESRKISYRLLVVTWLEFATKALATHLGRSEDLGTDTHEGSRDNFARIAPEFYGPLNDVKLQWVLMPPVVFVLRLLVGQDVG